MKVMEGTIKLIQKLLELIMWLRSIFFYFFNSITFYYMLNDMNDVENINFNYLFGFIDKKKINYYYSKKITNEETIEHIYYGFFNKIGENRPLIGKRKKNFIFINSNSPITINMKRIDDYAKNMKEKSCSNMKIILDFMGIKCTHIKFIEYKNLKIEKIEKNIDDVTIEMLYN